MEYDTLITRFGELNKRMLKTSYFKMSNDTYSGEGLILSYLCHNNEEATPAELSVALEVSTARIAALLNKMEARGLIQRKKHQRDRKSTTVCLLSEGRNVYEQRQTQFRHSVREFFETLGEEDAKKFVELQEKMAAFMSEKKTELEETKEEI